MGDRVRSLPRRGLVIGAGSAVGGAWALGVLCAWAETASSRAAEERRNFMGSTVEGWKGRHGSRAAAGPQW